LSIDYPFIEARKAESRFRATIFHACTTAKRFAMRVQTRKTALRASRYQHQSTEAALEQSLRRFVSAMEGNSFRGLMEAQLEARALLNRIDARRLAVSIARPAWMEKKSVQHFAP
jgi:hypothetical protein